MFYFVELNSTKLPKGSKAVEFTPDLAKPAGRRCFVARIPIGLADIYNLA